MIRLAVCSVLFGILAANICTTGQGSWSFALDDGVRDYYHVGVALNRSYYCFEGCLNTGTAIQNYKVLLRGKSSMVERSRSKSDRIQRLNANPDDPNADTCIDPVLRNDIASALNKTINLNCKGIAQSLLFNLNRPGWAINCVKFDSFGFDSIFADMNFCDYDAFLNQEIYNLRLAAIDFS